MGPNTRSGATALLAGLLLLLGCSKGKRAEDFTPAADKARQALEAALNHWKAGHPPGKIPGTSPTVQVEDARWSAAPKQLQDFEILGEDARAGDSAPRYFKVKLTMAKGQPQDVRYVVLGIDPLLVYREQDFDKLSGMGGAGK